MIGLAYSVDITRECSHQAVRPHAPFNLTSNCPLLQSQTLPKHQPTMKALSGLWNNTAAKAHYICRLEVHVHSLGLLEGLSEEV